MYGMAVPEWAHKQAQLLGFHCKVVKSVRITIEPPLLEHLTNRRHLPVSRMASLRELLSASNPSAPAAASASAAEEDLSSATRAGIPLACPHQLKMREMD